MEQGQKHTSFTKRFRTTEPIKTQIARTKVIQAWNYQTVWAVGRNAVIGLVCKRPERAENGRRAVNALGKARPSYCDAPLAYINASVLPGTDNVRKLVRHVGWSV
ncbi:unnamed protein product, partial [Iphiclides podalirius]